MINRLLKWIVTPLLLTVLFFNSSAKASTGRVITIDGINPAATAFVSIFGDSGTGSIYAAIDPATRQDISEAIGPVQPFYWNNDPGLYELFTHSAVESLTTILREAYNQTKATNSPLVIVSHSWGTVLAYIVLHENPDIVVDKLITMGSPLESITAPILGYTNITLSTYGIFWVAPLPNVNIWHNYWTWCDLVSGSISSAMNHESDISILDPGLCHSGYYTDLGAE